MDIIDSYQQQIMLLNQKREEIIALKDQIPDAPYHIFSINAMIRDAEMRYERLKSSYVPIKCNQCTQPVPEDMHSVQVCRGVVICDRCLKTISQVMNTTEMETKRGMASGTVKQDCYQTLHFLHGSGLVRKSGKFWLVHEALFELFYDAGRKTDPLKMSWIDEMENKMNSLLKQRDLLNDIRSILPGGTTLFFSLDSQIRDYENRLKVVKGGTYPFRCTQCSGWIKEPGLPILINHFTLCKHCKRTIEQVMTSSEAEAKFNLRAGRIRKDIHLGQFEKYMEKGLMRQSGSIWLMHESVIKQHYFPEEQPAPSAPTTSSIPSSLLERSAAIYQQVQERNR
ncbi:hypothetical protein [Paenibacillus sp. Y412MC10]|uniref:hypothetical protein n=1 Tax=Geobacillus sp. (strain Y412MC10) TaxID=481743 RepID=UPI0011AB3E50|nr:hypothetical protein [Paenibacillus sp. Y412MC10]